MCVILIVDFHIIGSASRSTYLLTDGHMDRVLHYAALLVEVEVEVEVRECAIIILIMTTRSLWEDFNYFK